MADHNIGNTTAQELHSFVEKHGDEALGASMKVFELLAEIDEPYRVALLAHIERVRDGDEEPDANPPRLLGEKIIRQRYAFRNGEPAGR